jgi:hypothetical protein
LGTALLLTGIHRIIFGQARFSALDRAVGGGMMKKRNCLLPITIILILSLSLIQTNILLAKDKAMTAEQVVSAHLQSIGPADVLAGLTNRGIQGSSTVKFIIGGTGTMTGRAAIVTSGRKLAIRFIYDGLDYPGEYFTFNGSEVQVRNINPGQRSPLGDFLFRYNQLMKEGLIGGVYYLGWALLDMKERNPLLKYFSAKVDGRELHGINYTPKGGMNDIKVKLFFEPGTFRHVRTEYALKVHGEQALQSGQTVTLTVPNSAGQRGGTIARNAGILDQVGDSNYLLVEKYDDFKEIDGMTLPQRYTIEYSVEGQGSSFLANWIMQIGKWVHNQKIDPSFIQ